MRYVSKSKPCIHCKKPDWCYVLGETASVCRRKNPPATGWVAINKTDKEGHTIYVTREHNEQFWEEIKQKNGYVKDDSMQLTRLLSVPEIGAEIEPKSDTERTLYYNYGDNCRMKRREEFVDGQWQKVKNGILPQHKQGNQWKNGLGKDRSQWTAYRLQEALKHCSEKWVLAVEGEKCVEVTRQQQYVAITWQASNWGVESDIAVTLKQLKDAGAKGLIYFPDHDQTGYQKAEKVCLGAMKAKLPYLQINPRELWSEMPEKGDIADWLLACPDMDLETEIIRAAQAVKRVEEQAAVTKPEGKKLPLVEAYEETKAVIGDRIKFNEVFDQIELDGEPAEMDGLRLELEMQFSLSLKVNDHDLYSVITKVAKENSYNPLKDYMELCKAKYSDTSVLDNLAERYFGVSDPIYQVYLRKTLIGAIARIYEPGCKFDTALVLYSKKQGIGKSTFLKVLAGEDYFCDDMGGVAQKDEKLKLYMAWWHEWSEIENITSRSSCEAVKNFLSGMTDFIRPPYGRFTQKFKRRCVITGSTNEKYLLKDPTGDRRFWVIPVQQDIPIEQLVQERDRIWGAALTAYLNGEQWYLTPEERTLSSQANEEFRETKPFDEALEEFLEGKDRVLTKEVLRWMGVDARDSRLSNQASKDIRYAMTRLGWELKTIRINGELGKGYVKEKEEEFVTGVTGVTGAVTGTSNTLKPLSGKELPKPVTGVTGNSNRDFEKDELSIFNEGCNPCTLRDIALKVSEGFMDSLSTPRFVPEKDILSHFSDPDAVKAHLKTLEEKGKIIRKRGRIYNSHSSLLKKGDEVEFIDNEGRGWYGIIERVEPEHYQIFSNGEIYFVGHSNTKKRV
jgi:predicted P-loop ATPase